MSEQPKKTIKDPIDPETLQQLAAIANGYTHVSEQLMDLEQERVRLIVTARQLIDEKSRVFSQELIDRGIAADAPVEVDAKTGEIKLLLPPKG